MTVSLQRRLRAARHELRCQECRVTWRSWAQRLLGDVRGYSPRIARPPADVFAWLNETYTPEGVRLWLSAYRRSTPEHRARMVRLARTPSGGT